MLCVSLTASGLFLMIFASIVVLPNDSGPGVYMYTHRNLNYYEMVQIFDLCAKASDNKRMAFIVIDRVFENMIRKLCEAFQNCLVYVLCTSYIHHYSLDSCLNRALFLMDSHFSVFFSHRQMTLIQLDDPRASIVCVQWHAFVLFWLLSNLYLFLLCRCIYSYAWCPVFVFLWFVSLIIFFVHLFRWWSVGNLLYVQWIISWSTFESCIN